MTQLAAAPAAKPWGLQERPDNTAAWDGAVTDRVLLTAPIWTAEPPVETPTTPDKPTIEVVALGVNVKVACATIPAPILFAFVPIARQVCRPD
jgi:hypothetical protein